MRNSRGSLWLGSSVLAATLVIFVLPRIRALDGKENAEKAKLGRFFPSEWHGVKIQDMPLGSSEFLDQQARDKLDYDDMIFRSYVTTAGTFTIYTAYWKAGRFSPSFVAAHTPDRCWTMAGMTCLGYRTDYLLKAGPEYLSGAEWRKFTTQDGQILYVVFWHKVGDHLHDYGGRFNSFTDPLIRVKNVIGDLFAPQGEQYFIRLTSDCTFDQLMEEPVFQEVLIKLKLLGLVADAEP